MGKIKYDYYCPVCGCELDFLPWDDGIPSDEICPCCDMQFGYYDSADPKDYETKTMIYNEWRDRWIREGMQWRFPEKRPSNWDPKKQLQNIGVFIK